MTAGGASVVRSTSHDLSIADTVTIDGIRCLTAERLILEAPLFAFTKGELENAIDAAIRLRSVHERRLRSAVEARERLTTHRRRLLPDALIDMGGESTLERRFLALVRQAGLPRPTMRRVVSEGSCIVARVDALFAGGLVVELEGHATHSSRLQRQHDEARRTSLVLRGLRVITFTYADLIGRPDWCSISSAGRSRDRV